MKLAIALPAKEIRMKSPVWLRFLYNVDRALLRARREVDPLETAYDKDYVLIAEKDRNPF